MKSRYCVLTNTEIAVFKSMDVFLHQGESSVKMLIPIDQYTIVGPATSTSKIDKRNSFIIKTKEKNYELNADSEDDATKWIRAIENAKFSDNFRQNRSVPQQPRFSSPPLAPSHVQSHASPLPVAPRNGGGSSSVNGVMVIPPGVDPDQFLSFPKDIQDQILRGDLM